MKFILKLLSFFNPKKQKETDGICYVGGLRRCLSIILDLIIILLMLQIIHIVFVYAIYPKNKMYVKAIEKYKIEAILSNEEKSLKNIYLLIIISEQIIQLGVLLLYQVYMWVKFATTIGKFIMGLKVVDERTFKNMTITQAIKRFIAFPLSGIPFCLGIVWANFDKRKQTWHDKIAKTVVVTNNSFKKYAQSSNTHNTGA
ncbi:RDD family protein [Neoehrlichia mikurensis]|uniref:RDD family protein n=1 Tax=Neoehrlichia mikurensis TaxID=89586 RepID=UPI001C462D03|nr:RDD family protein [Neoehrlichia mikurensis]QXK91963.1 RDD family protein [Neoehrlichia mikurensis]QXK93177.1 RDD family protein [Neoehrlichia mikurensis]QXK93655.1 RDD family protein [Neoehrlichia mikurensis]